MPTQKHSKRRTIANHKWKGRKPFESKSAPQQLPDTSRIPWLSEGPTIRKTGTDNEPSA